MRIGIMVAGIVFTLSSPSSHSVTAQGFDDQDQWRAAVQGDYKIETFEIFSSPSSVSVLESLGVTLSLADLNGLNTGTPTVRSTVDVGGLCDNSTCPEWVLVNDNDTIYNGDGAIVIRPSQAGMTFEGIGYLNTGGGSDVTALRLYDAADQQIASWQPASAGTVVFVGLANPGRPAVRAEIRIVVPPSTDFFFTIDDLQVSLVPEPETYAMFLAGLGVLVAAQRLSRGYHK